MHTRLLIGLIALATFLPLPIVVDQVQAQGYAAANSMVRIDGFDVQAIAEARPGNELIFTLYGSPGGTAAVMIRGATGGVELVETEAGVYEGSYTIRRRDTITAQSTATANLRIGNQVISAILDEPMIGRPDFRRAPPAAEAQGGPKIDSFEVTTQGTLAAGDEMNLKLVGNPAGKASARIAGVKGKIILEETEAGVYEGSYTIKRRDRIESNGIVTGHLRLGKRETHVTLGQSLLTSSDTQSRTRPTARHCHNCGVVESINVVQVKGEGTYLGKIAGGMAGILLGSQIGHGSGKTVAQVAGAAGGAYAGNEIEKRMKATQHHEVVVRLDNGGAQTLTFATQPTFAVGTRVKVDGGNLTIVP